MALERQLREAIKRAQAKGVKCLKIELEAAVDPEDYPNAEGYPCTNPSCHEGRAPLRCKVCQGTGENEDGDECEPCSGTGESTDFDQCGVCDGYGRIPRDDSVSEDYFYEFETTLRKSLVDECDRAGLTLTDVVTFLRVLPDISVGTEATITIPIDKVRFLDKVVECFVQTAEEYGNSIATDLDATERAGMHMTLLWTKNYPSTKRLSPACLQTFKQNVEQLKLALVYLGSVGGRTRSLGYRDLNTTGRGFIDYHEDTCIEFRSFDPCYECPSQILDNFVVIS